MRQYAINLRDGRVVLCTRETLTNIDYYAISEKVALAIENGILDRNLVIAKVKGKLLTSDKEWDALLTQKTTQNVRRSDINPESAEKSETVIPKEEVTAEFDMEIPGEEAKAEVRKPARGKAKDKPVEDDGEDLEGL